MLSFDGMVDSTHPTRQPSMQPSANSRPRLLAAVAMGAILLTMLLLVFFPLFASQAAAAIIMLASFALGMLVWQGPPPPPPDVEKAALQERLGYRADLLDLMTSNEPRAVILADKWERILFANREAARRTGRSGEELIGSTLASLLAPEQMPLTRRRLREALRTQAPLIHVDEHRASFNTRIMQTSYVPVPDTPHIQDAVLITENDITSVISERDQREKMLRQMLDVFVSIADRRDPHATGHSALVGELSRQVAEAMSLPDSDVETAEIAGLVMNFGKVLVPLAILTKAEALTEAELQQVRQSMMSAADVLSIIQFDLPVVATLHQLYEHFDGSGLPEGRRGSSIIVTARICAAVNVFVALISTRAHRQGIAVAAALDILLAKAGTIYDPAVLAALTEVAGRSTVRDRLLLHQDLYRGSYQAQYQAQTLDPVLTSTQA